MLFSFFSRFFQDKRFSKALPFDFDEESIEDQIKHEQQKLMHFEATFPGAFSLQHLQQKLINTLKNLLDSLSSATTLEDIYHTIIKISALARAIKRKAAHLTFMALQLDLQIQHEEILWLEKINADYYADAEEKQKNNILHRMSAYMGILKNHAQKIIAELVNILLGIQAKIEAVFQQAQFFLLLKLQFLFDSFEPTPEKKQELESGLEQAKTHFHELCQEHRQMKNTLFLWQYKNIAA
jgi:hypothetical protein